VIEDIYVDDRIPHDAYRPTFVRSLTMVPIRRVDPIGAIGNYWRSHHRASPEEVELLRALADATAVAMENVALWSDIEKRVAERTAVLDAALKVNERLLGTMTHELRNAVGACQGLLELVLSADDLPAQARTCASRTTGGRRAERPATGHGPRPAVPCELASPVT
jgi:hypothetical protein